MWNRIIQLSVVALLLATGGCSTITQGSDQTVTVGTNPSGASCTLKRDGSKVGAVNPTPGSVTIGKSSDDVSVRCKKEGYQTKATSLRSEFEGMTFGNILLGGFIGLAVDASSGAMNEYPSSVNVSLTPKEFPSDMKKKEYFREEEERIKEKAQDAISKIEKECGDPENKDKCAKAIEKIKERREEKLAELEAEKAQAAVSDGQDI